MKEICGTCKYAGKIAGYARISGRKTALIRCERYLKIVSLYDACLSWQDERGGNLNGPLKGEMSMKQIYHAENQVGVCSSKVDCPHIIHCGQCKYYGDHCCCREFGMATEREPDDFCSCAEWRINN